MKNKRNLHRRFKIWIIYQSLLTLLYGIAIPTIYFTGGFKYSLEKDPITGTIVLIYLVLVFFVPSTIWLILLIKHKKIIDDGTRNIDTIKEKKDNSFVDFFKTIYGVLKDKRKRDLDAEYKLLQTNSMNGVQFEIFITNLFQQLGYNAITTKKSGDQGVDVIAEKDGVKIAIQTKCYSKPVGNKAIQEVVAGKNYYKANLAMVVTNSTFTESAIKLAKVNDVVLWNGNTLKEKIKLINN